MALALNRYLCSAVLPLITKCAPLFAGTDHRAIMIDSMLHTIYRLSRGRALTKAQRDVIEECLMSLCKSVPIPISPFGNVPMIIGDLNGGLIRVGYGIQLNLQLKLLFLVLQSE